MTISSLVVPLGVMTISPLVDPLRVVTISLLVDPGEIEGTEGRKDKWRQKKVLRVEKGTSGFKQNIHIK